MRTLVAATLVLAALVVGGSAQAATWPASCHDWTCVNNHLNQLHAKQQNDEDFLYRCLGRNMMPLARYNNFAAFDGGFTTGLDFDTGPNPGGNPATLWTLVVNRSCAKVTWLTAAGSRKVLQPLVFAARTR